MTTNDSLHPNGACYSSTPKETVIIMFEGGSQREMSWEEANAMVPRWQIDMWLTQSHLGEP